MILEIVKTLIRWHVSRRMSPIKALAVVKSAVYKMNSVIKEIEFLFSEIEALSDKSNRGGK